MNKSCFSCHACCQFPLHNWPVTRKIHNQCSADQAGLNAHYYVSYIPSSSIASLLQHKSWALFCMVFAEQNYKYLHVYLGCAHHSILLVFACCVFEGYKGTQTELSLCDASRLGHRWSGTSFFKSWASSGERTSSILCHAMTLSQEF